MNIGAVLLRLFFAGGNWNNAAGAGVFALNGNNARSNVNANVGFRSALPAKSEAADLLGLPTVQRAIKEYSPSTLALCACGEKLIAAYTANAISIRGCASCKARHKPSLSALAIPRAESRNFAFSLAPCAGENPNNGLNKV